MKRQMIVVLVTTPSKKVGQQIAKDLLEKNLAACINIISPIESFYTWQGETCDDEETLLIIKSRAELFEHQLIPAIQRIHPYEVPEIIALPIIMGLGDYLNWVEEMTSA